MVTLGMPATGGPSRERGHGVSCSKLSHKDLVFRSSLRCGNMGLIFVASSFPHMLFLGIHI